MVRRHPWIFSGAISSVQGQPESGEIVDVYSADGAFLARAGWSPESQIVARVWTYDKDEVIDTDFFRRRIERSIRARDSLGLKESNAVRLVNAESDGLPGLVVDHYGDYVVCQFLTAGAEYWKEAIAGILNDLLKPRGIYERSDLDVRLKEGLSSRKGRMLGDEPPELIEVQEGSCRFLIDVRNGHKTGFYLDQRDNRAAIQEFAHDREMLNCFAYTGGFGIAALVGGAARVTNVEASGAALELARKNTELNGFAHEQFENVEGDVFQVLRKYRDSRREFDLIVLDPPKFVESRNQLEKGCRGYKDINLLAFKLLRPGGILFTFSCSGLVQEDLFQKIVADAALDARREGRIIRRLHQSGDHPTSLTFPEGAYLKGFICQVD